MTDHLAEAVAALASPVEPHTDRTPVYQAAVAHALVAIALRHDRFCAEVLNVLTEAKGSSEGSLRSGPPTSATGGQEGGQHG